MRSGSPRVCGTVQRMAVVNVEVRPGVTLLMDEREAKRRGLEPIRPGANKKQEPAAVKKAARKRKAEIEPTPEETTDGIRNDG